MLISLLLTRPNRILIIGGMNWQTIISEIRAKGFSQAEIGRCICRSQAWVAALVAGKYKDVAWSDGQALLALHSKVCNSDSGQGYVHVSDAVPPEVGHVG